MKYSCGLWSSARDLAGADDAMLHLICERAGIEDGMKILDVGAGWGALPCWIAEHYPNSFVYVINRSLAQSQFIMNRGTEGRRGFLVLTGDARTLEPPPIFDRVLAIEMIEHTGNPEAMLARMKGWLAPGGRIFVQAITHRGRASARNLPWSEPGIMLSDSLLDAFESGLVTLGRWTIDGTHYQRTIQEWLSRLDARREQAIEALGGSVRRYRRWRSFLIACEEMFGWDGGDAWRVVHRLYEAGNSEGRASTS